MKIDDIVRFLNSALKVKTVKDESRNGLQVRAGKDVHKTGFAVDACIESFKKAKELSCDLLIVHHGLYWKNQKYVSATQRRANYLKNNGISLYAAHLPLDMHPKYGNNRQLCEKLGVYDLKRYARYHGFPIGYKGKVKEQELRKFVDSVDKKLHTKSKVLDFGPRQIKTIGLNSGGGGFALEEAMGKLDCFLVGEISHSAYHLAKESKLNVIVAGHYKTETLGLRALQKLLHHKFNIDTVFIDIPTGM
jgi:dinuclear metal center YbgI/SA1388 family protein